MDLAGQAFNPSDSLMIGHFPGSL